MTSHATVHAADRHTGRVRGMTAADLVVRSTRVVTPRGVVPASLHVKDGRIARVSAHDDVPAGANLDDAGDFIVGPGLVDTHVHVNEPGRAEWEGFETATAAAAAGGITTIVDMPLNSVPATTTVGALEEKRRAAEGRIHVDVAFWGGVVPGNAGELRALAAAGVRGFKAFMIDSGVDEFPPVGEADLRDALPILADLGLPLLVHAESPAVIAAVALPPDDSDPTKYRTWLSSRPAAAEVEAIEMLVRVMGELGGWVHVVHLSAAGALPVLQAARARGLRLTVETCPHYLTFAAEDVPDRATNLKCAPPIRDRANRDALWRAVQAGDIDLIATDHSPCPPLMKQLASGDFLRAWGGIASLEVSLAAVWTGLASRGLPPSHPFDLMAAAPARLAGLHDCKGTLLEGYDADFVIWDPDAHVIVDAGRLRHRHKITPYHGLRLRGEVQRTYLGGRVVYAPGGFEPGARCGRLLSENRWPNSRI